MGFETPRVLNLYDPYGYTATIIVAADPTTTNAASLRSESNIMGAILPFLYEEARNGQRQDVAQRSETRPLDLTIQASFLHIITFYLEKYWMKLSLRRVIYYQFGAECGWKLLADIYRPWWKFHDDASGTEPKI